MMHNEMFGKQGETGRHADVVVVGGGPAGMFAAGFAALCWKKTGAVAPNC